jgi:hypothetical protein
LGCIINCLKLGFAGTRWKSVNETSCNMHKRGKIYNRRDYHIISNNMLRGATYLNEFHKFIFFLQRNTPVLDYQNWPYWRLSGKKSLLKLWSCKSCLCRQCHVIFHRFTVHFDSLSFFHTNSCTFTYNYVLVF